MRLIRRLLAAMAGRPNGRGPAHDRHGHAPDIDLSRADLEEIGLFEIDLITDADLRTTTDPLLDRLSRKANR